jgi:hypothetical protein
MPIITLTDGPEGIIRSHARLMWWRLEILAHSFYPSPAADAARRQWALKVLREFATDWTSSRCPVQPSTSAYHHWMALHGLLLEQDEAVDLKRNEDRDLKFAATILQRCILEGSSKAHAVREMAKDLLARRGANSLESAETTIKRGWCKYNAGCHLVAAEVMVGASEHGQAGANQRLATIAVISLAEELRSVGESTKPAHGSVPLLNRDTTWKVPDSFPRCTINLANWKMLRL